MMSNYKIFSGSHELHELRGGTTRDGEEEEEEEEEEEKERKF